MSPMKQSDAFVSTATHYAAATRRRGFARCSRNTPCLTGCGFRRSFHSLPTRAATADESRIIDVTGLANHMRSSVREYTAKYQNKTNKVCLAGILAGRSSHAAETYSENIAATLREDGLEYTLLRCSDSSPEHVKTAIDEINRSEQSHGIIVFYPVFPQRTASVKNTSFSDHPHAAKKISYYLNPATGVHYKTIDDYLRDCVHPWKDVEGLCHNSTYWQSFRARGGRLPNDVYIPCTVTAVLKILETYHLNQPLEQQENRNKNNDWEFFPASHPILFSDPRHQQEQRWKGITITVINRSTILGRPLAALLALEGALVYSVDDTSIIQFQSGGRMRRCSSKEVTLHDCVRQSSVIVTAVPGANFCLNSTVVQDNTTIVDVSEQTNVDSEALLRQKSGIQLISRVGKVTIAALEQNLIRLHYHQQRQRQQ